MTPIHALLAALSLTAVGFVAGWARLVRATRRDPSTHATPAGQAGNPGWVHLAIGAITNFFDTLGIGSFATTTTV